MDARRLAYGLAAGRATLGAAMLAAPGPLLRAWLGSGGRGPGPAVVARATGARDLALGLGAIAALRSGKPARGWFAAGAASDAVDCAATWWAGDALPALGRRGVAGLAGAGALSGLALFGRLD